MVSTPADIADAFQRLEAFHLESAKGGKTPPRRLARRDLEPILCNLGITRVGDLTELDNIRIPVWSAVRPASRSLSVSSGKGLTHEAAWVSAVMESCEQALAEEAQALTAVVESSRGLARRGLRSVPLDRQSRCAAGHLSPDRELAWVKGLSLTTGEHVYAPYELVGMDMVALAPWNIEEFRMSSVGLASGGDLESALAHGLHELIEDDALFGALLPGAARRTETIAFVPDPRKELDQAMEFLAAASVEARFCLASSDTGLPVVIAALVPKHTGTQRRSYFCGSGCRSTMRDTVLAALLEAVQCRTLFISGARDDLFEEEYGKQLTEGIATLFDGHIRQSAGRRGSAVGSEVVTLNDIAAAVTGKGIGDIYAFPLGGGRYGFDVVRVLADDLVSVHGPDAHARSGRAARKLLQHWTHQ